LAAPSLHLFDNGNLFFPSQNLGLQNHKIILLTLGAATHSNAQRSVFRESFPCCLNPGAVQLGLPFTPQVIPIRPVNTTDIRRPSCLGFYQNGARVAVPLLKDPQRFVDKISLLVSEV